jgi:hypothetical protein
MTHPKTNNRKSASSTSQTAPTISSARNTERRGRFVRYFALKLKTVFDSYVFPGCRIVEGKVF